MDVTPAKSEHGHYRAMMTINQKSFKTKKNSPSSRSLSLLGPRSLSLSMSPPGGPGTGSWMTDNGDGDQIQNLERTRHESGQRQKFNFVKHQRFFGLTSSNKVLHQGGSGGLGLVPGPREI